MFKKATKKQQKARVCLIGAAGSGKTYTALTLAKHLGSRIAVIDTERGSASKYAGDVADFDVCEPSSFQPKAYITAMHEAYKAGYDVIVIDSLSHAWEGEGGILDQVDQAGGRFDAWKNMSPQLRGLIDAILTYPGHVVATLRTKTEYVIEQVEKKGRVVNEPRKIGLAPKFKDGLEYEFDVVATMDDGIMRVSKSRCGALNAATVRHPGADVAKTLRDWLDDGEPMREPTQPRALPQHEPEPHDAVYADEAPEVDLASVEHSVREDLATLVASDAKREEKGRRYRQIVDDAGSVGIGPELVREWLDDAKRVREMEMEAAQ